jgi:hypothetical protein
MTPACPKYETLLREYDRALRDWVELNDANADAALSVIENTHQSLTDHLHSCRRCLTRLGRVEAVNIDTGDQ